jgi:hypothetical protein|nr:MAG TPA: hypothetical protein [Caudoviricetes sp.]
MVTNDLKLKRTLDEADDKKACQLSLYYLKKLEEIFSDEKNIDKLNKNAKYSIDLDIFSILRRLNKINNITPSNHLLNLIEVKIRETNFSLQKIDNELFNNYRILINYLTILVNDIYKFLTDNNGLTAVVSLIDLIIIEMEYNDDFDDSNLDYYNGPSCTKDDYEFSAEEGYDNWFGK